MGFGRVLLVDDDEEARATIGAVLQAEGFEVLEARNGLHALQQLMRTPLPKVILLDMTMPVMTGFEFLDYKGQDPRIRELPVIAVTAYDKVMTIPGVVQVVRKPFDLAQLLSVLKSVLS
ncbi:MAG TPA: response regulator [Myxococcales bacterium]|nr:response regulator [Myxococcales bacterium]